MKEQKENVAPEVALQWHVFRKSLPLQVALQETLRALGATNQRTCLEIGAINGVFSYQLRRHGGSWKSVAFTPQTARQVGAVLEEEVPVTENGRLPFEDRAFDDLVVSDALERVAADEPFIEECHRVLKPEGKLIISVRHRKQYSLIKPLQGLFGLTPERLGLAHAGYSETDLFLILKNGFDVMNMRSYCRLFVTIVDTFVQRAVLRHGPVAPGRTAGMRRTYSIAGLFYRLAYQLDMLLFASRGFVLIALAKRRSWRPRNAPVLTDGRSLTEAVLTRPSG